MLLLLLPLVHLLVVLVNPDPHLALRDNLPSMTHLNIEVMKQLLAEQAKVILNDVKVNIRKEVSLQLEPYFAKLKTLDDEQPAKEPSE